MIQVPNSIKPIVNDVNALFSELIIMCLDDVPTDITIEWERRCNHELFHQDIERYISDLVSDKIYGDKTF